MRSIDMITLQDVLSRASSDQLVELLAAPDANWNETRNLLLQMSGEASRYEQESKELSTLVDYALMRTRSERRWPGWYIVDILGPRAADVLLAQRHPEQVNSTSLAVLLQPWTSI